MSRLRIMLGTIAVFVLTFLSSKCFAQDVQLRVVGWNVESGDYNVGVLARRIENEQGVDIWGFSEVASRRVARRLEQAAEDGENADFRTIVGTTGGEDLLAIVYNANRLDMLDVKELADINIGGRVRAPLVATFKGKTTGITFLFMVNHLYRGDADGRRTQSTLLNQWGRQQSLPVIAVGDYNYDWHYQTGARDHDDGYELLTKDGVFSWVRPEVLVPTNSSNHKSVLDFVFVHGDAAGWEATSRILVQDGDFPDDARKSDHRPVDAVFQRASETTLVAANLTSSPNEAVDEEDIPSGTNPYQEILERLSALEEEIARLKEELSPDRE